MSAPGNVQRLRVGAKDNWRTPPALFKATCASEFDPTFVLDAAADDDNHLCPLYYTEETDGLKQPWVTTTWCNPPYSLTAEFVDKAIYEFSERDIESCLLVPAATDTRWFARAAEFASMVFLTGRVSFINPESGLPQSGNTTGSVLLWFDLNGGGELYVWDWKKDL